MITLPSSELGTDMWVMFLIFLVPKKHIKISRIKNHRGPQHKDTRALIVILRVGVPFLLISQLRAQNSRRAPEKSAPPVAFQTQTQNRSVFSRATSQIATLPPVVALNRNSKSQIAARYAAFWHAVSQIALVSFL